MNEADFYKVSNSWCFVEARKILDKAKLENKKEVIFETGYGPSGLPHIGTFGEVARTSMVMFAFSKISDIPCKLIVFSDDMDGFRKVPSNVPNQEKLMEDIGKPLTEVLDPFGKFNSFGEHNNNRLKEFLDNFNFQYEFYSSTTMYKSGFFNDSLIKVLENYEAILKVIFPTLGDIRQATYSPFLPVCPKSGKVLQAEVISVDKVKKTITYINDDNETVETEVVDGKCKLQWKVDWAMRWFTFGVDYEMSGKDLIDSVKLSSKICKILGKNPPINLTYELFLAGDGQKISKSKGNGVSMEQWLKYANKDSLAYFMFLKPQTAKRLYIEAIPKFVDDFLLSLQKYHDLSFDKKLESPIYFIFNGDVPKVVEIIDYSLILNLIAVSHADNKNTLWAFLDRYKKIEGKEKEIINSLLDNAINYYKDFVEPTLVFYKNLTEKEKEAIIKVRDNLKNYDENVNANDVQNMIYEIGKSMEFDLKSFFGLFYKFLLGKEQGPRLGTFFALYGIKNSVTLIDNKLLEK